MNGLLHWCIQILNRLLEVTELWKMGLVEECRPLRTCSGACPVLALSYHAQLCFLASSVEAAVLCHTFPAMTNKISVILSNDESVLVTVLLGMRPRENKPE